MKLLYEGKAKEVFSTDDPDKLIIKYNEIRLNIQICQSLIFRFKEIDISELPFNKGSCSIISIDLSIEKMNDKLIKLRNRNKLNKENRISCLLCFHLF